MKMDVLKSYVRGALRAVRVESRSNLFWWQGPPLNFGDWIGPYLFKYLAHIDPVHRNPSNKSLSTVFITVGSCARWFCEDSIVWGSGVIEHDEVFWRPRRVCAVRGRFTRKRMLELGYDCPEVYGDPAVLLPDFYDPELAKQYKLGVVPHYCNFSEAKARFEGCDLINVIDVRTQDVESIVREIKKCDMILSSSLHGLILANAYSIPGAQVEFTSKLGGDGVKFLDYFSAYNITPPEPLVVEGPVDASALESFINSYPQPDPTQLKQGLYDSCPFNSMR